MSSHGAIPRRVFYMARHGETKDNSTHLVSNRKTTLTEKGVEQAKALQDLMTGLFERPENCYFIISDLPRARATAELATPHGWSVDKKVDDRIAERNNGNMSGRAHFKQWLGLTEKRKAAIARGEDATHLPNGLEFTDTQGETLKLVGAESLKKHIERVKKSLKEHLRECPEGKQPIFFCHEGVVKRAAHILGHEIMHIDNGGLYKFTPCGDEGWEVTRVSIDKDGLHEELIASTPVQVVKNRDSEVRSR